MHVARVCYTILMLRMQFETLAQLIWMDQLTMEQFETLVVFEEISIS